MQYWLMKSEPNTFSLNDLKNSPRKTTEWDGVRNYQARNMLRDKMKKGDNVFFYHSNCKEPGIVGIAKITKEGYPDSTAFDHTSLYHDPKSDPANPRWYMVNISLVRPLQRTITLAELKLFQELIELPLVRKGNRLSIMPVNESQWHFILGLEKT